MSISILLLPAVSSTSSYPFNNGGIEACFGISSLNHLVFFYIASGDLYT